jgi:hypothetical protein
MVLSTTFQTTEGQLRHTFGRGELMDWSKWWTGEHGQERTGVLRRQSISDDLRRYNDMRLAKISSVTFLACR